MSDAATVRFEPGKGPFRSRGRIHKVLTEYLKQQRTWTDVLRGLPDEPHRAFFSQTFAPTGWYDILPIAALESAAQRVRGASLATYRRNIARIQFEEDITGLHRMILRFTSPHGLLRRSARLGAQNFDFGAVEIKSLEARECEIDRTEVPTTLVDWYVNGPLEYMRLALESTGARSPSLACTPVLGGIVRGVPVSTIRMRVRWT